MAAAKKSKGLATELAAQLMMALVTLGKVLHWSTRPTGIARVNTETLSGKSGERFAERSPVPSR